MTVSRYPEASPRQPFVPPEQFKTHINDPAKVLINTGTADAADILPPRLVLMTDAPPRAEEREGMVHLVTEQYGRVFEHPAIRMPAFGDLHAMNEVLP